MTSNFFGAKVLLYKYGSYFIISLNLKMSAKSYIGLIAHIEKNFFLNILLSDAVRIAKASFSLFT